MSEQAELLQKLKNKAVDLLARREHAIHELRDKLLRNLDEDEQFIVDDVIEQMIEAGYLCEQRYADMLLRSRVMKGYGAARVRQELAMQKVDSEAVMLAFERDDTDWFELAKHTRQRKFGDWDRAFDLKQKAKQQRYLYSRGFSSDQVNYAFELDE